MLVLTRVGETWSQQANIAVTPVQKGKKGLVEAQRFGSRLELSGDGKTALISDLGANKGKGAIFVYTRSGESWSRQATLIGSGVKGKESFGNKLALSEDGSTVIAAGPGSGLRGAVWFFTRSGETWAQQGPSIAPSELKPKSFFGADPGAVGRRTHSPRVVGLR